MTTTCGMESASMAAERSTRRTAGKRALGRDSGAASEPETTQQPTPGRQMVDFDPWAVLLEQLMETPEEKPTKRTGSKGK